MTYPILYSLQNCPYAMRARIAIYKAKQQVVIRAVVLSNKPNEMIAASAKATVPILVLSESPTKLMTTSAAVVNPHVIDESLAIMLWALNEKDPFDLLDKHNSGALKTMLALIRDFDEEFKVCLEQYKCAKRYHERDLLKYRQACEVFIQRLENGLTRHKFLISEQESLADIAVLPYIRQFAKVERQWYLTAPYPHTKRWLNNYLQSPMFTKVMAKYPIWSAEQGDILFTIS